MRIKTLVSKVKQKEAVITLIVIAWVLSQHSSRPIFAEYAETSLSGGINLIKASETVAEMPGQKEWDTVTSDYFTIYYRPEAKLKSIERKLRRRMFYVGKSLKPAPQDRPAEKIAYRMDVLFRRVKEILGMYPRIKNIDIKIFKDRKALNAEYYRIFRKKANLVSFYIYKKNTIYTSERDISDSVMCHEMGHAVADNYFAVRPPGKIREILSTYVDMHLDD